MEDTLKRMYERALNTHETVEKPGEGHKRMGTANEKREKVPRREVGVEEPPPPPAVPPPFPVLSLSLTSLLAQMEVDGIDATKIPDVSTIHSNEQLREHLLMYYEKGIQKGKEEETAMEVDSEESTDKTGSQS